MATIDSQAVFMNRAGTLGVPDADMKLLDRSNLASFARFAFSCTYQPGSPDDSALKVLLESTLGAAQDAGKMSVYRRLFYESFTLAAAELRSRLDRSEDQGPRKLPVPERSARLSEQKKRLTGLVLEGELEPSDSLIDFVYSLYEENRLQYVQWDRCSKKDAEVAGHKRILELKQDANGVLKINSEEEKLKANVSSDIRIRYALQRRSLSFDQVTIATYKVMEKWHDCMFRHRMREALPGYGQVTLQQLEAADKALFQGVSRACRDGIVPKSDGTKPMDEAIEKAMESADVQFHLLPHLATKDKDKKADDDDKIKKVEKVKKNKWDKNTEKGGGKRFPMPAGLHGGVPKNDEGDNLCFDFNLGICATQADSCPKGKHQCCRPKCFRKHAFIKCTGQY